MSEPLSAVEIEDVLTSIRRLVSEDLRPSARAAAQSSAARAEAASPALILTPALRVVPDAEPAPAPVVAASPVEAVAAAVAEQKQDWEPETGDALADTEPVWAETVWDAVEEIELPETDGSGLPETGGSGLPETGGVESVLQGEVLPEGDSGPPPGWAQSRVDEGREEVSDAVMAGPDAADPVIVEAMVPPHPDADWMAQAEAEVIAGLQQDDPDNQLFDGPEDGREISYDEEVLRDLVRDLIREELQGHLGARITRNIRKLVRAEIARALTAAELQ